MDEWGKKSRLGAGGPTNVGECHTISSPNLKKGPEPNPQTLIKQ